VVGVWPQDSGRTSRLDDHHRVGGFSAHRYAATDSSHQGNRTDLVFLALDLVRISIRRLPSEQRRYGVRSTHADSVRRVELCRSATLGKYRIRSRPSG